MVNPGREEMAEPTSSSRAIPAQALVQQPVKKRSRDREGWERDGEIRRENRFLTGAAPENRRSSTDCKSSSDRPAPRSFRPHVPAA